MVTQPFQTSSELPSQVCPVKVYLAPLPSNLTTINEQLPSVNAGVKFTGSAGLSLIVMLANTSLCGEGGCSVIPSFSLP
jgi:hypothetical protein